MRSWRRSRRNDHADRDLDGAGPIRATSRRPSSSARCAQQRADVERTLDAIQERLSPGQLVDQAMTYLQAGRRRRVLPQPRHSVKQNPVPIALIGVGLAWMMASSAARQRPAAAGTIWVDDDADDWDELDTLEDYETGAYAAADYPYGASTGRPTAARRRARRGRHGHGLRSRDRVVGDGRGRRSPGHERSRQGGRGRARGRGRTSCAIGRAMPSAARQGSAPARAGRERARADGAGRSRRLGAGAPGGQLGAALLAAARARACSTRSTSSRWCSARSGSRSAPRSAAPCRRASARTG